MFVTGREFARRIGLPLDRVRVIVQGFGNVGSVAASLFAEAGARIVAVQDHTGTILDNRGLDIPALVAAQRQTGDISAFAGGERIADEDFWDVAADILIPAALEGQLTAERARRVTCRLVLEGANGPTVTVSYFEWVQDFSSFFWTEAEINARLDRIMGDALERIWEAADRLKISRRTAAFAVACERILAARAERGLYP